jgi:hypothetical protein
MGEPFLFMKKLSTGGGASGGGSSDGSGRLFFLNFYFFTLFFEFSFTQSKIEIATSIFFCMCTAL